MFVRVCLARSNQIGSTKALLNINRRSVFLPSELALLQRAPYRNQLTTTKNIINIQFIRQSNPSIYHPQSYKRDSGCAFSPNSQLCTLAESLSDGWTSSVGSCLWSRRGKRWKELRNSRHQRRHHSHHAAALGTVRERPKPQISGLDIIQLICPRENKQRRTDVSTQFIWQ